MKKTLTQPSPAKAGEGKKRTSVNPQSQPLSGRKSHRVAARMTPTVSAGMSHIGKWPLDSNQ